MNHDNDTAPTPDAPTEQPTTAATPTEREPAAAPKTRAPRRKAAVPDAAEAVGMPTFLLEGDMPAAAVQADKPARRPRKKAVVDTVDATPPVETDAPASIAPAVMAAPVAYPSAEAQPPREAPPPVERLPEPADPITGERAGDLDNGIEAQAAMGGSGAPDDAAAGAGDLGEKRGRRRNRRRGKRGDIAAAGEPLSVDGDGDGGEPGAERDGAPDEARAAAREALREEFSVKVDPGLVFEQVLSGGFDAEPSLAVLPPPAKRVLPPDADAPKLHKVLAQAGVGSRRDMEQLIEEGRVTVNGEVAHTGQRVSFGDEVRVAGKVVRLRIAPPAPRVIAYHKPAGEVVTQDDPQQRPTVFRRLPRLQHGKWQSVGRLDINTEGLLLFTNSGDLANKLMHPRFGVEREYAVRVLGTLDEAARASLLQGVPIEGQTAAFSTIADGGGAGANHWYRVTISEGRNREVRRLFEAVGLAVSRLIRIRYGCVVLPKGLRRGVWIDLDDHDVRALRSLTGTDTPAPGRGAPPGDRRPAMDGRRGPAPVRPDRPERLDRPERPERAERPPRADVRAEPRNNRKPNDRALERGAPGMFDDDPALVDDDTNFGPIPNPLQQTYDNRAMQQRPRDDGPLSDSDDDHVGPIPNPLQQTYDRRFVQSPRGGGGGGGGGGNGGGGHGAGKGGGVKKGGGGKGVPRQPDPMQTSVGYIGADTFLRKVGARGGGPRGGQGGQGGPGGRGRPKR